MSRDRYRRRLLVVTATLVFLAGCAHRPAAPPREPEGPAREPENVDAAISDVASGGSWEEGGHSGIYRVVVRSAGRHTPKSDVVLEWLRWDDHSEQPVEERRVHVTEVTRGGIVVTSSKLAEDDGRTVVKLDLANPLTGAAGEARIWPVSLGRYRAKLKWAEDRH